MKNNLIYNIKPKLILYLIMRLRSRKQTTPHLILEITEIFTEKRALRKRHPYIYKYLKTRFKIHINNAKIVF